MLLSRVSDIFPLGICEGYGSIRQVQKHGVLVSTASAEKE